jgi:hypothetical protein
MAKEPFSLKDASLLKEGILAEEAGYKPFEKFSFGKDFTLRPETVFGALPGIGDISILGQAIGKYQTEDASNRLLGIDKGFQATLKGAGTGGSATTQIINEIKEQKANDPFSTETNITRDDIQKYIASKRPDLDLAPIQNTMFTKAEIAEKDAGGRFGDQQVYTTQPFRSGRTAQNITGTGFRGGISPQDRAMIEEDIAISGFSSFDDAIKGGFYDNELKSVSDFAEDKITQSNIRGAVDAKGRDIYDPAFARAVTLENQGDTANADTTFICTVLFEMNILPMSIYKYDQRYGQQVNRRIYNGYALWGKPLAERIRKQGLAYKIMTPIACAWAEQMAYDLSDGKVGKNRISIKIAKFLGETICYTLGLFIKPKGEKNARTHIRNRQHGAKRGTIHGKDGISKGRGRPRTKR